MWNIDIETRIRDLNAEAENHNARLLDTMTETDGSAKSTRIALARIVERFTQALGQKAKSVRALSGRQAPIVSSR